MLVILDGSS